MLAAGVFLLGFLIAPAVHVVAAGRDHTACGDGDGHDHKAPEPHKADQCGICQPRKSSSVPLRVPELFLFWLPDTYAVSSSSV